MRLLARLLLPMLCLATLAMPVAAAAQLVLPGTSPAESQTLAAAPAAHCEHAAPAAHAPHDGAASNPAPAHGVCAACVGHCLPAMIVVLPQPRLDNTDVLPTATSADRPGITTLPELKPPRA